MHGTIILKFILLLIVCNRSSGTAYRLNETEYEILPKLFELENYDACLENPGAVYCVASLSLHGKPDNRIYNVIQEYSKHTTKHFNYSHIDRGICVTRTCKNYMKSNGLNITDDLKSIVEGCLGEIVEQQYGLSAHVFKLSCDEQTEQRIKLDYLDYLVGAVTVAICSLVLAGSYYDIKLRRATEKEKASQENRALLCFSVFQNTERLTNVGQRDERLFEFKGLHGARVIAEILIVFGHSLFTQATFVSDPHSLEKLYESNFRLIFTAVSLVQIFFAMTGFLMTYNLNIQSEKESISWKNIPNMVFYRWWKLIAPLAFVGSIIASWLRHLGSGPLWKVYITNGVTQECRKYYWAHLFFINNYFDDDKKCLVQTWHLAVDMQLYIIGLVIYFLIQNRSWRFKAGTLVLATLIGIVSPILQLLFQNLDVLVLTPTLLRTLDDDNFNKAHVKVQNNLPCFVLGMIGGYVAYYLKQRKIEFPNFKLGNIYCWCTIFLITGFYYVASFIFDDGERPLLWNILYQSTHRLIIGVIIGISMLGVILNFNGFSKNILEWRGFALPSKLSYGVFLVHIEIIYILIASRTQLAPVSFLTLIFTFIGVVFVAFLLAFVLHLLVEAPASRLLALWQEKIRNKKKQV